MDSAVPYRNGRLVTAAKKERRIGGLHKFAREVAAGMKLPRLTAIEESGERGL